jgi:hypothetical protein
MKALNITEAIKFTLNEYVLGPPRTQLVPSYQKTDDLEVVDQELEDSADVLDQQSGNLRKVADQIDKISQAHKLFQSPRGKEYVCHQLEKVLDVLHQCSNDVSSVQYDVGDALDKIEDN